jgi:hypothetical protein
MRLIAVLRDPVERAYSAYQMELRWGRETGSFEEALAREAAELPALLEQMRLDPEHTPHGLGCSYVTRGLYADQLERWLQHFDRAQLLILTSDELAADPGATMAAVTAFLGIPGHEAARYERRGVQEYAPMHPATRDHLERTFAEPNRRLAELLGRDLPWSADVPRASSAR